MENRRAVKLGLLLSQGGEFGFVLFAAAQSAPLIAPEAASLFAAIVTISMASTPFLMTFNAWFARRAGRRERDGREGPEGSHEASDIVVVQCRFGHHVVPRLLSKGGEDTILAT